MKIIIITKSDLRFIPPVISVAYILKGLGHDVHIITSGASDSILKEMNRKDITIDIYPYTTATTVWKSLGIPAIQTISETKIERIVF